MSLVHYYTQTIEGTLTCVFLFLFLPAHSFSSCLDFLMALQDSTESQKYDEKKVYTSDALSSPSSPAVDLSQGDTFPPQDGGKGAWLFLAGASIIEVVAWGWSHINAYS